MAGYCIFCAVTYLLYAIEKKSQRTNSTFGFADTLANAENQKNYLLANARQS